MGNHPTQTEDKLFMLMKHSSHGMAEIDMTGSILNLNARAEIALAPVITAHDITSNNFYDILAATDPELTVTIKQFIDETDNHEEQKATSFLFYTGTGKNEKHFTLQIIKLSPESILLSFEENTEKIKKERLLKQAILEKNVLQGKFEIASNVLHDIGNAVVGFSSYLTRIKRLLETDHSENLQNLVGFFEQQRTAMSTAIGEAKSDAVVKILSGIAQTQRSNQSDISKSITEQQHIITHIQEILNIQRQYINGSRHEEKPVSLTGIINDCMAMLYASLNKRNIDVSQNMPDEVSLIKGDRTKLMQVILNLLKNSIEAIDIYAVDKTISITIINHTDSLVLQIKDSGKGFDAETSRKLFTRGFTTKSSGSGLGLDHCRAILESHQACIDITSEGPGKGALTTIKFNL